MIKKLLPLLILAILLCGCSQEQESAYGDELMVLKQEAVYTMFDDTQVSYWTMGMLNQDYYCIEGDDGEYVEILVVENPIGPEGVMNNGLCYDDLNETAKAAIGAYYEAQGLLYDVSFEVENAYAEYERRSNNKRLFNWHYISQTVWPTGGTDEVIGFCTELIAYRGEEFVRQHWYNVLFDRETGEQIPIESIFSAPLDEAKALILDALMPEEPETDETELREQMEDAFRFDYIKLMNDGIEVMFPADTLECKEKAFGGFIPAEELADIMQPWALNP